jgi:hypothetical protein
VANSNGLDLITAVLAVIGALWGGLVTGLIRASFQCRSGHVRPSSVTREPPRKHFEGEELMRVLVIFIWYFSRSYSG